MYKIKLKIMAFNFNNLGEQTINKIAEVALAKKLEKAEELSVQVKIDRQQLSKGILDSLVIDGKGLMVNSTLRLQEMKISLDTIVVSPFKALRGNIQLMQPSLGKACIVLNEKDIAHALHAETLNQQLRQAKIALDGKAVTVEIKQVKCQLLENKNLVIKARFWVKEIQEIREVELITSPCFCATEKGIIIEVIECLKGEELSPLLINALLEEAKKIFNLSNFKLDGISLEINHLNINAGKLTLQGKAGITHFPKS